MGEHRWMGAVLGRCTLYSLTLGGSFLLLGAVLFGLPTALLVWLTSRTPEFSELGPAIVAVIFLAGSLCLMMTTIGLVGGSIAGFYSPPHETRFPAQSPFFRCVIRNGIGGFFAGALCGGACGYLLSFLGADWVRVPFFLGAFCAQICGLGRGVNLARRAALALPREIT